VHSHTAENKALARDVFDMQYGCNDAGSHLFSQCAKDAIDAQVFLITAGCLAYCLAYRSRQVLESLEGNRQSDL